MSELDYDGKHRYVNPRWYIQLKKACQINSSKKTKKNNNIKLLEVPAFLVASFSITK